MGYSFPIQHSDIAVPVPSSFTDEDYETEFKALKKLISLFVFEIISQILPRLTGKVINLGKIKNNKLCLYKSQMMYNMHHKYLM